MHFTELAKKRCSVRSYADKPLDPQQLQAILEAGRLAPTGKNHQPQRLLVVQSPEGLAKMANAQPKCLYRKGCDSGLRRYHRLLGSQLRCALHP